MGKTVTVGVTGASGSIYAARTLRALDAADAIERVDLVVSRHARIALDEELDVPRDGPLDVKRLIGVEPAKTVLDDDAAIDSRLASGSNPSLGMVVIPCSMGTLARLVHGVSDSLLLRAADVCLKEQRKLILAVRETPLNQVHLRNLLAAAEVGATVMPAMPAFYQRPQTLDDMVDHFVARVLAHLGVTTPLGRRWRPRRDDAHRDDR